MELNEHLNLLDIGCGSGIFSDYAQFKGISVTGIDACENLIKHAKQRNPEVHFLVGDMEELPFDNGIFDLIVSNNGLNNANNTQ